MLGNIWSQAGPEFGNKAGSIVMINRALYGLATSRREFHEFLGDLLQRIGFTPSRANQDLYGTNNLMTEITMSK